ncbi:hypothetical protein KsCSTR_14590 [Candidatus Kuenenia stuttgartiensis]|jgi:chromosome segregation ATPase|uniref:Uncharacterized protein n=1 Tax=Kuenenia stuttgartiensis TaxID=174633 RepID=Q1Q1C8_KUEST|nr:MULTISPECIES: hypothetical protein [Kuenenia]MBE7547718.1 hypothetical protein [Planctomycetia bacterium]MBZ0191818.1 hypothetical protein [Candidatus Kuenenia stuttgartiensis]MCL4725944.1 hypothetical protein [Candidatus Kuenenia stuttgartiensis]MCZ7623696.1 hypothetical protein [Candidatus Kuenenia sp.]QII10838.1 hypothetical protein KsCSTR_14590 [Candidatus Kuenenia stuttgartiensis]
MGNEQAKAKGFSVNAKTLIIILLFINIAFAAKMISKYYSMKDLGYRREKTFKEETTKRVMKAFASVEEANALVNEIKQQKEAAENAAKLLAQRELDLKRKNEEMNDAIAFLEAEKAKLQGEIWALEDQLSLARQTISDMRSGK